MASPNNGSVRIMLGSGGGQFINATGSPVSIPGGPIYIAIADFNSDSFLDMATANYYSGAISVFLGNGAGGFTQASGSPYTTASQPYCIDVADFNLDGNIDLITSNATGNNLFLFHGNGVGTFTVAPGFPMSMPGVGYHVSAGFFNSDVYPDFALINGNGSSLRVLLGSSKGLFSNSPGSPYTTGTQPRTIAVKDLNNDGFSDLVVTNLGSNDINIFLGSSNGAFSNAPGSPMTVGSGPYQSVITDLDLNGTQDIVVTNNASNSISILLGTGTGSYNAATNSPMTLGSNPQPICSNDFNNDGKADLAIGDWGGSNINVLINYTPINCSLQVNFTANGSAGNYTFNSTSSGTLASTSYSWNFGDGSPLAGGASNIHTYGSSGSYTVTLTANNNLTPSCIQTFTQIVVVGCNLSANFNYLGNSAGSFTFNSSSTGTVPAVIYLWNFGDGSPLVTGSSIVHTYSNTGTYTVSLTANNIFTPPCIQSFTQVVNVACNLSANFSYSTNSAGTFNFISNSSGTMAPTTFTWNYGDSSPVGNGPSSSHTYSANGTFIVTLLVSNNSLPACVNSFTKTVSVIRSGIKNEKAEGNVNIWPNPSSGQIQVSISNPTSSTELILYNLLGQVQKRWSLSRPLNLLNLEFLGDGIYLYRIVQKEGLLFSGHIILTR